MVNGRMTQRFINDGPLAQREAAGQRRIKPGSRYAQVAKTSAVAKQHLGPQTKDPSLARQQLSKTLESHQEAMMMHMEQSLTRANSKLSGLSIECLLVFAKQLKHQPWRHRASNRLRQFAVAYELPHA